LKFIKLAKKHYCIGVLAHSANKSKTTWNNIKNMKPNINISSVNVNSTLSHNSQIIAKVFHNYFTSVAQNILVDDLNNENISSNNNNPLSYLSFAFNHSFPNINLKYASTKETEDKTNSLKMKYSLGYNGTSTKVL
jgi:hypothetical protein